MKARIGTLRNSVLGVVLCGAIAPTMAQEASAPVEPASRSIYQSLELGFKLCSNHILRRGHLSSKHTQMLDGMGVTLVDTVPENISLNTGPLFAQDRIFAEVASAEGQVYISTARDTIGMAGDAAANPLTWIFGPWSIYGDDNPWYWSYIIKGADVFNNLPGTLEAYDAVVKPAVDPYTAVKDAYIQYRRNAISQ